MWTTEDLETALRENPCLSVRQVIPCPKPLRGSGVNPTMRQMDKAFSEVIRKRAVNRRGGCERCGGQKQWQQLQCSHFHGRAKWSVRFDSDNCAGLCSGCHMYLTAHPLEHIRWFKGQLGETKFTLLEARASIIGKPDIEGIWLWLKAELGRR